MTCVRCGEPATVHLTSTFLMPPLIRWISLGRFRQIKRHRHLCEACARAEGLPISSVPVDELLKRFAERREEGRPFRPPE